MNDAKKMQVLEMLVAGYAQKTISRATRVAKTDISKLGREYGVGRRPGMTRKQVQGIAYLRPPTVEQAFARFFAAV